MILNEGIRFFKDSKRIKKAITTLNNKLSKVKDPKDVELIKKVITKMTLVQTKLEILEKEFSSSKNKKEVKQKYDEIKKEVSALIDSIDSTSIKVLKSLGMFSAFALGITGLGFILKDISVYFANGGEYDNPSNAFKDKTGGEISGEAQKIKEIGLDLVPEYIKKFAPNQTKNMMDTLLVAYDKELEYRNEEAFKRIVPPMAVSGALAGLLFSTVPFIKENDPLLSNKFRKLAEKIRDSK